MIEKLNQYIIKSIDCSLDGAEVLSIFKDEPFVFLLDSSENQKHRGRYSFLGFNPFDIVQGKGGNDLTLLREKYNRYKQSIDKLPTPLPSGIVGFLSYDYGLHQQKFKSDSTDEIGVPDYFFGFYDCILTLDHLTKKMHVTALKHTKENNCEKKVADIVNRVLKQGYAKNDNEDLSAIEGILDLSSNFSKNEYKKAVIKALDYISQGEIYQVNLSQRFSLDVNDLSYDPIQIYQQLRYLSPSSFSNYFNLDQFQIISSSPERFLHLKNGIVQTRPMKGTRPRGKSAKLDELYRQEIITNKKEKAELLMITDLERNDLGKVCEYGSVKVNELRTIEEYATVFQATSTVEGRLRKGLDAFDLLKECFPGGSITGCPKIRSMQIIDELEPSRRSIYTGSLGYVSFTGDMDFNILIRTLLTTKNNIYFQVGSGIVADSIPEDEYQETLVKAQAMTKCLKKIFAQKKTFQTISS